MSEKPGRIKHTKVNRPSLQPYERYLPTAFDESLSMLEKINKVIYFLYDYAEITEEMMERWNEVYEWVVNEGLEEAVHNKLVEWKEDGTLEDILENLLLEEYARKDWVENKLQEMQEQIQQSIPFISIEEMGADIENNDNTEQIQDAIDSTPDNKRSIVRVPSGTWLIGHEIRIPSNVTLMGDGNASVLKLNDDADKQQNVIITKNLYGTQNENIVIRDLTVDWNKSRFTDQYMHPGPHAVGSGVSIVNAQYVFVDNVRSLNPAKHCFDITSTEYSERNDSQTEEYEDNYSQFIWLNNCYGIGAGDDCYTTHFSGDIHITNSMGVHPSATLFNGDGNSNCFEVDDGSWNVTIDNCYSEGGVRGFTSEAHISAPAPINTVFSNCIDKGSIRSFDARHIGYHGEGMPLSPNAFDVTFSNCTSYNPANTGLYDQLTPRALDVSAYRNVNITNFNAIGGGGDQVTERPVSFQFNSRNINVNGLTIRGFTKAEDDLRLLGKGNETDYVNLNSISIFDSAPIAIRVTRGKTNVNISNMVAQQDGAGTHGIWSTNSQPNIINVKIEGYAQKIRLGGNQQTGDIMRQREGAIIGSSTGQIGHERAVILSSSVDPVASGNNSMVASSTEADATAKRSVTLASYQFINNDNNTVAGGHSSYYNSNVKSSSNQTWMLRSSTGNIKASGSIDAGHGFGDIGEYMESANGKALPTGQIVTLEGKKKKKATQNDTPVGVISETASLRLGGAPFHWQGRYLKNEFGGLIYEWQDATETDEDGNETTERQLLPRHNPEYEDIGDDYQSRQDRDEWNMVGLMGQMFVRVDDTVKQGDYITPKNGIGTQNDHGWPVMKLSSDYDPQKGYGVAVCMVK